MNRNFGLILLSILMAIILVVAVLVYVRLSSNPQNQIASTVPESSSNHLAGEPALTPAPSRCAHPEYELSESEKGSLTGKVNASVTSGDIASIYQMSEPDITVDCTDMQKFKEEHDILDPSICEGNFSNKALKLYDLGIPPEGMLNTIDALKDKVSELVSKYGPYNYASTESSGCGFVLRYLNNDKSSGVSVNVSRKVPKEERYYLVPSIFPPVTMDVFNN